MKAVLQNFRSGELSVSDVPPPTLSGGGILVHNVASLVSAGTEKAVIELAKMNPVQKARARPDLVKKVLNKAGQEGLLGTAKIVMNLVNAPLPLGYSSAGIVQSVGSGVSNFKPGDAVACAGLGYANHAEVVFVPKNLAVAIPGNVSFDEAAYVTLGAIAMHGVRQGKLNVGEYVVILGLGLVGQLTAQICLAAGLRVFGVDLDPSKVELALNSGIHSGLSSKDGNEVAEAVKKFTQNQGADAIIITASTKSSQPVELAAELARDRARVVAVGDVGLNIPRRAYFQKEIDLRLSRSYGPGRYDVAYEEQGCDYPIGYVRWTENRNMGAFLDLVAQKKIQVDSLTTHRFPIQKAEDAYKLIGGKQSEPYLGILIDYDAERKQPSTIYVKQTASRQGKKTVPDKGSIAVGVIGAGQFCQGILLPNLKSINNLKIIGVATGSGLTSRVVADKYNCEFCTSDYSEILAREDINAVIIATRHNLHSKTVIEALSAGKHAFVEKPLAINQDELNKISTLYSERENGPQSNDMPVLMVGFNRRFSPLAVELKKAFIGNPLSIIYRVNAGSIPPDSWVHDPVVGGGRIVGEVCHFVDFMQFLTGSDPVEVFAWPVGGAVDLPGGPDNVCIQIKFSDGSIGSISYISSGDSSFPKERVEVFGGGRAGYIDNWRKLEIRKQGKKSGKQKILSAAKGHAEELAAFAQGLRDGRPPISIKSLFLTTQTTFAIQSSISQGKPIPIETPILENP